MPRAKYKLNVEQRFVENVFKEGQLWQFAFYYTDESCPRCKIGSGGMVQADDPACFVLAMRSVCDEIEAGIAKHEKEHGEVVSEPKEQNEA